ncbi:MAG: BMP family ABC transporter substrate-binding protein [Oscillospiraceae bacterium]|jgi:basic membrane protein A
MKKFTALLLALAMVFALAACGSKTETSPAASADASDAASDVKIGIVLVGDENVGYDSAHIEGIKAAAKTCGIADEQIIWKYNIEENEKCADAIDDLVSQGCKYVFSDSYGHQSYMQDAASKNPDVTFIALTGDTAATSGLKNLKNAFNYTFESRYVSGVVAGMKLKELVDAGKITDANKDANGNIKIGYVGAFSYAEVVSGYTAFYLGVKSIVDNVVMDVQYTNSWYNPTAEGEVAKKLVASGDVIISQHADSTGAPSACEELNKSGTTVFCVGYNVDMLSVAPTAALTSAQNNWSVFYTYAFDCITKGEEIKTDWAAGYDQDAVMISKLGASCAEGTEAKVQEVEAALKDGSLKVFDTSKFTVDGQNLSSYTKAYGMNDQECIKDGAFEESTLRSAPYFDIRIDGITEINGKN